MQLQDQLQLHDNTNVNNATELGQHNIDHLITQLHTQRTMEKESQKEQEHELARQQQQQQEASSSCVCPDSVEVQCNCTTSATPSLPKQYIHANVMALDELGLEAHQNLKIYFYRLGGPFPDFNTEVYGNCKRYVRTYMSQKVNNSYTCRLKWEGNTCKLNEFLPASISMNNARFSACGGTCHDNDLH